MPGSDRPNLLVFADDWGRHPSSCQHLVRHLLDEVDVTWVNTTGTRKPHLTPNDLRRAWGKLARRSPRPEGVDAVPTVLAPLMYPGFRNRLQRAVNAKLLTRAIEKPRHGYAWALTTLPITADLVGRVPARRWVYYCVDDFSQWPGADHAVMDAMERELVAKVDAVVAVSETLRDRLHGMGRDDVTLLTHGVDLEHWRAPAVTPSDPPTLLFWGLIDQRLDRDWLGAAPESVRLVLLGPTQDATGLPPRAERPGPAPYVDLPRHAAAADVLVMPYIDAPVTRAMQPLKLKEYLATYKPVVVRDLPATREWADCCDVVSTAEDFARICLERARTGLPADQRAAREHRLPGESWSEKANALRVILQGGSMES